MASCSVTTITRNPMDLGVPFWRPKSKKPGCGKTIGDDMIKKKVQVLAEMLNQKNEFRQQKED